MALQEGAAVQEDTLNQPHAALAPASRRRRRKQAPARPRSLRTAIIVAFIILAPVIAIPAYGYYQTYIAPLQMPMVRVNDTVFTMGDYVERMHYLDVESKAVGQKVDYGSDPFRMLDEMRDDELVRQSAPRIGVTATNDEITAAIKARLLGLASPDDGLTAEEVDRNFNELYKQHLAAVNLSDEKYRKLIEAGVLRSKLRDALSDRVPAVAEHAHVLGVKVDDIQQAQAVKDRLDKGEDIQAVARELSTDPESQNNRGDLGWVPKRGLDRQLDNAVFSIELNTISDPIFVNKGFWIVKVLGREVRTVEGKAREQLKDRALQDWLDEERQQNRVEQYFDSDRYAYVIDKVHEYKSPDTGTARPQAPAQ